MARIFRRDAPQVTCVGDALTFSDLKDDGFQGELVLESRFQGAADAGCGAVHRAGHEVDGKLCALPGDTEFCRELNGFDSAGLVKGVAVGVVHQIQDFGCGKAIFAAHQRFVGPNASLFQVNKGLKGHGQGKTEPVIRVAG